MTSGWKECPHPVHLHHLDEAHQPRGKLGMADIALDRSDPQRVSVSVVRCPVNFGQRLGKERADERVEALSSERQGVQA